MLNSNHRTVGQFTPPPALPIVKLSPGEELTFPGKQGWLELSLDLSHHFPSLYFSVNTTV